MSEVSTCCLRKQAKHPLQHSSLKDDVTKVTELSGTTSQPAVSYSKLTIETLEQVAIYLQI